MNNLNNKFKGNIKPTNSVIIGGVKDFEEKTGVTRGYIGLSQAEFRFMFYSGNESETKAVRVAAEYANKNKIRFGKELERIEWSSTVRVNPTTGEPYLVIKVDVNGQDAYAIIERVS